MKGLCQAEECERPRVYARFCITHHRRMKEFGSLDLPPALTVEERFWSKVTKTDGCWLWTGAVSSTGYGSFNVGGRKYDAAHRYAWRTLRGSYPSGMHLDHLCRVRKCVNPDHLEVVTFQENLRRAPGSSQWLHERGVCRRGHVVAEDAYVSHAGTPQEVVKCARCARATWKSKATGQRPPKGLRGLIYERSGGLCECCLRPMALASMHLHHRKLRSQGGTWDPENIIGVLSACHNIHPRSIHQNPQASYDAGLLVRREDDPAQTPVIIDGEWYVHDARGHRTPVLGPVRGTA